MAYFLWFVVFEVKLYEIYAAAVFSPKPVAWIKQLVLFYKCVIFAHWLKLESFCFMNYLNCSETILLSTGAQNL